MNTFTLHTPQQGHEVIQRLWQWAKPILASGRQVRIKAGEAKRTLDQNSIIHPLVNELADMLGRPKDRESLQKLRYLLLEQWRNETGRTPMFERSLDGLRWVNVDSGTSDLDKPDASEFIEWMMAQREQ